MKVFKLYFKVLRKYIGFLFMYVGIFLGVTLGVIVPQNIKNSKEKEFTDEKCDFAFYDYDNSTLSQALKAYLQENHNIKTIDNDDRETIQDALYNWDVHAVVTVEKGFEEKFSVTSDEERSKIIKELLGVYVIPNTVTATLFEQNLNSYLSMADTYISAGFDIKEATEKAMEVSNTSTEVSYEGGEAVIESPVAMYFKYFSWVFIAMCITSISVVLISLNKKEVRDRVECSPYKFFKMNMEIVFGVIVTGFVICTIFIGAAFVIFPEYMLKLNSILYIINAFSIMSVALAITFLVSKLTDKSQVISLLANVIGLGMAFLCGVFVPLEFLSDTIIKIAHFLPVYWNVKAIQVIGGVAKGSTSTVFAYMGIQILFAIAIIFVGMIIDRRKRVAI